jgi:hypothetical protein
VLLYFFHPGWWFLQRIPITTVTENLDVKIHFLWRDHSTLESSTFLHASCILHAHLSIILYYSVLVVCR